MSKSKKNTIDPEKIIEKYGADSVRLFILSDSPPEKDVQWSEEGMNSSYKFIQKLWVLNRKIMQEIKANHPTNSDNAIEKISNQFIKNVTNNIDNFAYNKIVANFHEMYSSLNKINLNKIGKEKLIENYKKILITMSPVIPHFTRECLELIGANKQIMWPEINKELLIEDKKNFVIQINGKTREIIEADKNINEEDLLIKINKNLKLKNYIENKTIKKKIFIPEKLINIIVV
jgi:leucyl-tRNA synthetase